MSNGPWTDQENDLIVADYFAMLADDISGRRYSKAEHRRALLLLLNDRSEGSVEFKHQNISAVLKGLGEDWIPGYKPAFNFQITLVDAVARWLALNPAWLGREPGLQPAGGLREAAQIWVGPPPTLSNQPPPQELEQMLHIARKFDVAANVLTPLVDQIDTQQAEIALVADKLRSVFRRHRILARGGQAVELTRVGDNMATLFVPGKGSIDIKGENRIDVKRCHHLQDGAELGIALLAQGAVEAFARQPGILGDLLHAFGARDHAQRIRDERPVPGFQGIGQVARNRLVVVEVFGRVKGRGFQCHAQPSISAASRFACSMSACWRLLVPPHKSTTSTDPC
ncbi:MULTISPECIES: hypothetical protein [Paracoccus]|uniref:hypothetical protein n=1 Tax=Paracoccus sp. AS002 TaxID=3019545 RepID=UPI001FB765EE|nr:MULTISPECIES: hypothetical protein [Paracoccus]MCJ1900459.1 hypothetical protein [Paracoccus versutus]MDF3906048.1 hypothetical protein [Paracoccus sp. AS002]